MQNKVLTATCKSLCTGQVQPPQLPPGVHVALYTNQWTKKNASIEISSREANYTLIMIYEVVRFQLDGFLSIFLQER